MKSVLHGVAVPDGSLLDMACGLESLGRRLDALLDLHAPAKIGLEPSESESVEQDPCVTLLVLGLVALRSKLSETAARAALEARAEEAGAASPQRAEGSWLR